MGAGTDPTIRVLVVDEDSDVLDVTELFLERASDAIDVETETDPADAVDRIDTESFDCVVSDYRMPGLDGLELYEAIGGEDSEMPFFLLSATDEKSVADAADAAGVTGFIQKSAGTDHYADLAERIEDAVG